MSAHYAMCRYDDATGSYIPLEVRPIGCGKDWRLEMTTHDRDKVIAAAKEADPSINEETVDFLDEDGIEKLTRFYAIAFENGRQAEREECLNICINHASDYAVFNCEPYESMEQGALSCALTIRARGEVK